MSTRTASLCTARDPRASKGEGAFQHSATRGAAVGGALAGAVFPGRSLHTFPQRSGVIGAALYGGRAISGALIRSSAAVDVNAAAAILCVMAEAPFDIARAHRWFAV